MRYILEQKTENSIDMGEMDNSFFLIGLLSEFMNRYQTVADKCFGEISWKQCFVLICIPFFQTPPTLKELSEMMGTSHQNVKQMLIKLEKAGFVSFMPDEKDRRKQRILLTEKADTFAREHDEISQTYMEQLFETVDEKSLEITIQTIMRLDEQLKKMQEGLSK